ncbi:patatin-like phospholipase family protein [Geobacter sp. DSM 9736]|uniref:patatin-like phospholipase family protein n=1 Tax=Geobacter sp. DSM 9736 TaxID=1277350 RepID=UPI000B50F644|nr:patatin-like phospholipase family protein [Geobacter sp. DSM 9736]SNB47614.1 NTE family protein [Geobacter sp. DSM 9736]
MERSSISLVLEGGGMRFPAFVGALRAIEEKGLFVRKIIGSGSGSLIGSLYAAGLPLEDIRREAVEFNVESLKDFSVKNLRRGKGLYSGDLLEEWIDKKLNGATFGDPFGIDPHIITTDIINYRPVIFNSAAHPRVKVSTAVRCSMGMPWILVHRRLNLNGQEHVLIDGSYMVGAVEKMLDYEREKTLVLKVVSKRTLTSLIPGELTMKKYFLETLNFSLHALEKEFIKGGRWRDTILLYCGDIPPAKFDLSAAEKTYLVEQGYEQTLKYLEYKWGI